MTGSTGPPALTTGTPGGVSISLAGLSPGQRTRANHYIGVRNLVAPCHIVNPERRTTFLLATGSYIVFSESEAQCPKTRNCTWGPGSAGGREEKSYLKWDEQAQLAVEMSPRCDRSVAQGARSKQWLYFLEISPGPPALWMSFMRIVGDRHPTQQETRRRSNDNDYRHSGTETGEGR